MLSEFTGRDSFLRQDKPATGLPAYGRDGVQALSEHTDKATLLRQDEQGVGFLCLRIQTRKTL
jgi:hypothetical protein